jgi:hypothetical protein
MIGMAGILFFLFIGFNYAFNAPDGFVETIWDSANETLSGRQGNQFDRHVGILKAGFGIGSILCFFLAIVFFIIEVLHRPSGPTQY